MAAASALAKGVPVFVPRVRVITSPVDEEMKRDTDMDLLNKNYWLIQGSLYAHGKELWVLRMHQF